MTALGIIISIFVVCLVFVCLLLHFSTKTIDDVRSDMEHHNHDSDDFGIYSDKENL